MRYGNLRSDIGVQFRRNADERQRRNQHDQATGNDCKEYAVHLHQ
jgi:hypothetical protein